MEYSRSTLRGRSRISSGSRLYELMCNYGIASMRSRRWSLLRTRICVSTLIYCGVLASFPYCSGLSMMTNHRPIIGCAATGTTTQVEGRITSALLAIDNKSDDSSTLLAPLDNPFPDDDSSTLDVFLRLSPLIGGPKFLPLHVEIMLSDNNGVRSAGTLHRFDFVPAKPTDPTTLGKLLTLQSVPGVARYRKILDSNMSKVPTSDALAFRLTSIDTVPDTSVIIAAAEGFTQQYQKDRGDLSLVRNSCFTYAYELLQFIKNTG